MLRSTIVLAVLTALAAPLAAQEPEGALYTGQISAQQVNVRTRPSTADSYVLVRLDQGTTVTVVREEGEWAQILPPEGVYSLISKRYVDRQDGTGTVTGDNVSVRAGSDIQPIAYTFVQGALNSGATVEIIGQTEEYYKIRPPIGVQAWVYAEYVTRAAPGRAPVAPAQPPATAPTTQPAPPAPAPEAEVEAEAEAPEPAEEPAAEPAPEPAEPEEPLTEEQRLQRQLEALEQARQALQAEFDKPVEQRDLQTVLQRFEALDIGPDSPYRVHLDYYLAVTRLAIDRTQATIQARQILQQAQQQQRELEAVQQRLAVVAEPPPGPPPFAAQGVLTPSVLFPGTAAIPQRWQLRDPATGRTVAYVQATPGVNPARYEGARVLVAGRHEVLGRQQVPLIHAQEIQTLGQ